MLWDEMAYFDDESRKWRKENGEWRMENGEMSSIFLHSPFSKRKGNHLHVNSCSYALSSTKYILISPLPLAAICPR